MRVTFRRLRTLVITLTLAAWATMAAADPSGRVAYVGDALGAVSYSPAGEDEWLDIVRNRPVIPGDRVWTDRDARVELQVSGAAIRLSENTSMELLELDDRIAQVEITEGTLYLRIERVAAGQTYEIATPDMVFSFDRPGRYRIDVDAEHGETSVIVYQGRGEAWAEDSSFPLRTGDAVQFYGSDLRDNEFIDIPPADAFDRYCSNRDRYIERALARRYTSDDVAGASALDAYGDWRRAGAYGMAWFPRAVRADWAPYRDGHWVWQEPWGWTWVDDARWGFAPSHYGRWVHVTGRWGWVPGPRTVRPVYAPALVVFIGGRGWREGGAGNAGVTVGWFPLAVREVYVPSYRVSREYFRRVNVGSSVVDPTVVINVYNTYERNSLRGDIDVGRANYANRRVAGAVTAVPRNVFVESRPVRQSAVRLDRKVIETGTVGRLAPVAPGARSVRGTGAAAQVRPPNAALARRVVVRTAPRAARQPFAQRQGALQARPGQAPAEDRAAPVPGARAVPDSRNVRVLPHASVDARAAGSRRKPRNGAAGAPGNNAGQQPQGQRPVQPQVPAPVERQPQTQVQPQPRPPVRPEVPPRVQPGAPNEGPRPPADRPRQQRDDSAPRAAPQKDAVPTAGAREDRVPGQRTPPERQGQRQPATPAQDAAAGAAPSARDDAASALARVRANAQARDEARARASAAADGKAKDAAAEARAATTADAAASADAAARAAATETAAAAAAAAKAEADAKAAAAAKAEADAKAQNDRRKRAPLPNSRRPGARAPDAPG